MATASDTELRDRESELEQLRSALSRNGGGRLVVLEGPAGIGKSALCAVACRLAESEGRRTLRARGAELEREFAFGVIRQLFEPVLRAVSAGDRNRLLSGDAAPAAWLLGPEDSSAERPDAGFMVLRAIYWLACNLAASGPLLIVVDDAHWLDASSLRALSFVARRIGDVPIVMLIATRDQEPGAAEELLDAMRCEPEALRLTPRALTPGGTAQVVRRRLPAAQEDLCAAFHASTTGNPLLLHELLLSLGPELASHADPSAAVRAASIVPLGERIGRRVARVAPAATMLCAAMAVLGDGGRLSIAAALAELDLPEAGRIATSLRRLEILDCEDPIQWTHPLVRRSIYDLIAPEQRDAFHANAAAALRSARAGAEAVSAQLLQIRPRGSEEIAAALLEAARHALRRAAADEAQTLIIRALAEGAPRPPREEILAQLGRVQVALRAPAAIASLREALSLTSVPQVRAELMLALIEIFYAVGEWQVSLGLIEDARREMGDGQSAQAIEVAALDAVMRAYDPDLVAGLEERRSLLEAMTESDGWGARALAAVLAALSANRGAGPEAVTPMIDRALQDGLLLAERAAGGWASGQVLTALLAIDDHERALTVCSQLEARARDCGSVTGLLNALGFRSWVYARRGQLPVAEAEAQVGLEIVLQAGLTGLAASGFFFLADAILERASLSEVAATIEATELEPVFLRTFSGAMLLDVRGRLRLQAGANAAAIEDLRACGRIAAELGIGPNLMPWRSQLALALPLELRDEGTQLVCDELKLARATSMVRPIGVAMRAVGLLGGDQQGLTRLRESVNLLRGSDARLEYARSLVELGGALRRENHRAEARAYLLEGVELARACGAERLEARALEELYAAGARPRHLHRSGAETLTASELRVARLAADEHSNPEIAQHLYVSLKTVETHLGHAYRKLGLSGPGSRRRLATALEQAEAATLAG